MLKKICGRLAGRSRQAASSKAAGTKHHVSDSLGKLFRLFLETQSKTMSLLVVGSVAFDAVETPFGKCEKMLGGSASHFSISASYFTDVSIVGVVGGDFGDDDAIVFATHGIDTTDLEKIPDGKTFRW